MSQMQQQRWAEILERMAATRNFTLGQPESPQVAADGTVLFLRSGPADQRRCLYEVDAATGAARLLLDPLDLGGSADEQLSAEEMARRERMRVAGGGFTGYALSPEGKQVLVSFNGRLYLKDRSKDGALRLVAEPQPAAGVPDGEPLLDPKLSPDGRWVSFVRGRELHVLSLDSGKEIALTEGAAPEVTRGLAEFAAQEEMDRFSGYWWAPDSSALLYEEADVSGVERHFIANPADPAKPPLEFRYPRAGTANAVVRLGLVPVQGGATTWIDWDSARFPYLANVHWQRGGAATLQVQSRDQKVFKMLRIDTDTGTTAELLEIRDPAWVNLHGPRNTGYLWLTDGSGFLWTREVEQGWVLELRSPEGKVLRTLTRPQLGLLRLVGVDEAVGAVIVEAGPLPERKLYRVSLEGGEAEPLLPDAPRGVHTAVLSEDRKLLVHTEATAESMPRTSVRRRGERGGYEAVFELPSVAETPPEELAPRLEFTSVGASGTQAVVIRPPDFEAGRRYPDLVSVYGGPHHIHVLRSRASYFTEHWLAAQGFVVVAFDGTGSWGYGTAWERPLHRRLVSVPLEAQSEALLALGKTDASLDLDRVGIYGWSFGGYLSARAVLWRPDLFKVAVAGAPVTDLADYDTHYTERYMGLPQEEPEAYRSESLLEHAGRLERPLLILHGTADDNVYFTHSLKLCDALLRAGRRFEFVPLAGQTHRVHDISLSRRQWELVGEFFARHLAPR